MPAGLTTAEYYRHCKASVNTIHIRTSLSELWFIVAGKMRQMLHKSTIGMLTDPSPVLEGSGHKTKRGCPYLGGIMIH